ncbi:tetratricopeptide repeat protein, partial [Candidatus Aminicenantes bacterium AC-335-A11]|nr:tetratricopeptide repeat protein [Candidatus Aminicenantes bacterium AC-335-A11]
QIKKAENFSYKGCYFHLQKAHKIYRDLYSIPSLKKTIAEKLLKITLLLSLREKELGIINTEYINQSFRLIKENSFLRNFLPYAEITSFLNVKVEGVLEDIDRRIISWRKFNEILEKVKKEINKMSRIDEFYAYFLIELACSRFFLKETKELSILLKYHPDSLSLKYKLAICGLEDAKTLKELIETEPCFYEIYLFLGKFYLMRKKFFEAEQNFLKALDKFPDSVLINISLASIYFYFEEFEKSIDYYNKCLQLAPRYRDALLGKAISLSYLEKHEEAILVLKELISLGKWYLGETNYWLAWNKHKLRLLDEAKFNIQEAKRYLPTSSEVFTLSGILAFENNDLDKAEKDLKKALIFEPSNSEALFNLGNVYAKKGEWENSGQYFEKAGETYETLENFVKRRIERIRNSSISEERKNKILHKLEKKLRKFSFLKATSFYNASAGFFNAGKKDKALILAKRAMKHPAFIEKAKNIISKIKK